MLTTDVVRAWTDEDFRAGLGPEALAAVPDHPAGTVDAELDQVIGAFDPAGRTECPVTTFSRNPCCF